MRDEVAETPEGRFDGDLALVASALADGVVVVAPGGVIVWANEAIGRLLRYRPEELIGMNALAMTHPDELERAIDGMVYASQFPGRTSVAPFRLQSGDGTWIDIELKSGVLPHPEGDHLVLVVRDGTSRQAINRALRSVASGDSLEATAELICSAAMQRWPNIGAAVSFGGPDGREVIGHGLTPALLRHAAGEGADDLGEGPWQVCGEPGLVAIVGLDELAEGLRAAATEAGFAGYAVSSVADPGGDPACLVVWFDHLIIASIEFRHAASELCEVLTLALERRHASWQLSHLASHDSLTGLLNRIGFFDQFTAELEAVRAAGDGHLVLLFLDLDDLKEVNDRFGHAAGDDLLVRTADRLGVVAGPQRIVARIGGDEFVVAARFPAAEASQRAEELAEIVVAALAEGAGEDQQPGSVSVGIAIDEPGESASQILERADAAMYRAKAVGKSWWSR